MGNSLMQQVSIKIQDLCACEDVYSIIEVSCSPTADMNVCIKSSHVEVIELLIGLIKGSEIGYRVLPNKFGILFSAILNLDKLWYKLETIKSIIEIVGFKWNIWHRSDNMVYI